MEKEQRATWIKIGEDLDVWMIKAIEVSLNKTIPSLSRQPQFNFPSLEEGFTEIVGIGTEDQVIAMIDDLCSK